MTAIATLVEYGRRYGRTDNFFNSGDALAKSPHAELHPLYWRRRCRAVMLPALPWRADYMWAFLCV